MSDEQASPPPLRPLVGVGNPVPRAKWVWLAPLLVVVVLLAAGGALFAASRVEPQAAGPERVAELFLGAVADDNLRLSYGLLCERQRAKVDSLQFRDSVIDHRSTARRAQARGDRTTVRLGDERRRVVYTVTGDGADEVVRLVLEKEPTRWAVCQFDADAG